MCSQRLTQNKTVLQEFLRSGKLTLVQTEGNKQLKENKRLQTQARKVVLDAKTQSQQKYYECENNQ